MDKINIAVLLGTTRVGARAEVVAKLVKQIGEQRPELEIVYVDPKTLTLPNDGDDDKDPTYSKVTAEADAFFIVTPEYNHSFPGSLKRVLDSELDNYVKKPVVLAGVSSGQFGGVRAINSLVPVLRNIGMVPIQTYLPHPHINDLINKDETIADEGVIDRINKGYDELIWFAKALKAAKIDE